MTIAIGMLCRGGIVIAADTQITNSDSTTYEQVKVKSQRSANGLFAAAYSSDDMNAAEMLVSDTMQDLNLLDPSSLLGVEHAAKDRMGQWASTFQSKESTSYTAVILAALVPGNSVNPERAGLYYCEPPGKLLKKTMENSKGYVAIGAGLVVTDPLFRTLFGELVPPRVCLAQISYLMYRAKKDCGGACGGMTDAVLLQIDNPEPVWIERTYMSKAEECGENLDGILSRLTLKIMSRNGFDDPSRFKDLFNRKDIRSLFGLQGYAFWTRTGEMIWEPEVKKMIDEPEKYLES